MVVALFLVAVGGVVTEWMGDFEVNGEQGVVRAGAASKWVGGLTFEQSSLKSNLLTTRSLDSQTFFARVQGASRAFPLTTMVARLTLPALRVDCQYPRTQESQERRKPIGVPGRIHEGMNRFLQPFPCTANPGEDVNSSHERQLYRKRAAAINAHTQFVHKPSQHKYNK